MAIHPQKIKNKTKKKKRMKKKIKKIPTTGVRG